MGGGGPEAQSRRTQEQIVAEDVTSTVDEWVFVAARQHGWMCTEKWLWLACESAGDSTGGRAHSPPPAMLSGVDCRETGLFLLEETTSLSGTLVFNPAWCAHLLGNELKNGPIELTLISSYGSPFTLKQLFCDQSKCFSTASRCSASSASDLPCQLIWIPPRSMTCGPSGPPSPVCWSGSSTGNVICRGTSSTTMSSAYSGRAGGSPDPLTHDEIAHTSTLCAAPAAQAAPGAALVEDDPSGSKRRKIHVDLTVRDWFLDVMDQWRTGWRWRMQQCSDEVPRLCPRMFDWFNPNTPYRWKRSAPEAPLGRRTLLSPTDMTRLSEHIM